MEKMSIAQYLATNKKPSKTKWGNIKTEFQGEIYDSKKEADYAMHLEIAKKASKKSERVLSWKRQIPFKISINGQHICTYLADFEVKYADGRTEYVDTKPLDKRRNKFLTTDVYRLKKKMVFAQYGIEILER